MSKDPIVDLNDILKSKLTKLERFMLHAITEEEYPAYSKYLDSKLGTGFMDKLHTTMFTSETIKDPEFGRKLTAGVNLEYLLKILNAMKAHSPTVFVEFTLCENGPVIIRKDGINCYLAEMIYEKKE